MSLTGPSFLLWEQHVPTNITPILINLLRSGDRPPLDSNSGGFIPVEVRSIDFECTETARGNAQFSDDPVSRLGIVSASFPSVVPGPGGYEDARLVYGGSGCEEVGGVGEELVREGLDGPAEGSGGEVCSGRWGVLV